MGLDLSLASEARVYRLLRRQISDRWSGLEGNVHCHCQTIFDITMKIGSCYIAVEFHISKFTLMSRSTSFQTLTIVFSLASISFEEDLVRGARLTRQAGMGISHRELITLSNTCQLILKKIPKSCY